MRYVLVVLACFWVMVGLAAPAVAAVECSHLWVARLPPDIAPGTHILRVRAIDEYGWEHVLHRVPEVVGHYW